MSFNWAVSAMLQFWRLPNAICLGTRQRLAQMIFFLCSVGRACVWMFEWVCNWTRNNNDKWISREHLNGKNKLWLYFLRQLTRNVFCEEGRRHRRCRRRITSTISQSVSASHRQLVSIYQVKCFIFVFWTKRNANEHIAKKKWKRKWVARSAEKTELHDGIGKWMERDEKQLEKQWTF